MQRKVLYVTNPKVKDLFLVPSIIQKHSDLVSIVTTKAECHGFIEDNKPDMVICDRPTFLLTQTQIEILERQCFNLHPSYLPYNRGYFPNFWSHYDGTPSGTTIHNIDCNIDTGGIVAQTQVFFPDCETLETSYFKLRDLTVSLFSEVYPLIRSGNALDSLGKNDATKGKTYYKADFEGVFEQLPSGWQTSLGYVRSMK